jgi:diguanylate cyclase (GGDEF)-like protein
MGVLAIDMSKPKRDSGPLFGAPAEDRFYSTRLRQLMRIDLDEPTARALWKEVSRHREELSRRLRRDVGQRVALLDYVVNVSPQLTEPQIIERDTLETIERRAIVDPLTGLFNREYFELALPRETERCHRSGVHAALVLMDLDRFKLVNDGHGHQKGDEVLRTVGGIVREQVRAVDIPCRYGGDELAAILTDTEGKEAMRIAERIRGAVEETFATAPVPVTVSVGLTPLVASALAPPDPFVRADHALYAAKRAGGNRVVTGDGSDGSAAYGGNPNRRRLTK